MNQKISKEKLIDLIENVVSNFDPTPSIVKNDFPLRWESNLFISDYDFTTNYLELNKDEESSSGKYLNSIGSAVVLDLDEDGSFEYWDGVFMIETHVWCGQLNTNADFPSYSLIHEKFSTLEELIAFLIETY